VSASVTVLQTNAHCISEALRKEHGLRSPKPIVIPNGIRPIADFKSRAVASSSQAELKIGYLGRVSCEKGCDALINAFAAAARTEKNMTLELVGGIHDSAWLERALRQAGTASSRISIRGFSNLSADAIISGWDVFAFPSLQEGLPYSVLEAMRAGIPIVASKVGGIPEAIRDGIDGLLVAPGDSEELSNRLIQLVNDGELRARLGASAHQRWASEFSFEHMKRRTIASYRSLLLSRGADHGRR